MRRGALILCGLFLSAGIGGCSLGGSSSASSGSFTGAQGQVAVVLNSLSSDASGNNYKQICSSDFSSTIVKGLGGANACQRSVKAQLKTIGDFTLTIKTIVVTGKTATATVQTVANGKKIIQHVQLRKESGDWRLATVF